MTGLILGNKMSVVKSLKTDRHYLQEDGSSILGNYVFQQAHNQSVHPSKEKLHLESNDGGECGVECETE